MSPTGKTLSLCEKVNIIIDKHELKKLEGFWKWEGFSIRAQVNDTQRFEQSYSQIFFRIMDWKKKKSWMKYKLNSLFFKWIRFWSEGFENGILLPIQNVCDSILSIFIHIGETNDLGYECIPTDFSKYSSQIIFWLKNVISGFDELGRQSIWSKKSWNQVVNEFLFS